MDDLAISCDEVIESLDEDIETQLYAEANFQIFNEIFMIVQRLFVMK